MKKSTMATVAVWLVAGAAAVFLGHTMTSEPTASAAPAPKPAVATEAPKAAPAPLPTITLEETVIVAPKPQKAAAKPVAKPVCWTHELWQGGSPTARTVRVCD